MKRYLSILFAVVLSLSLVTAVLAGATPDATFTIGDISVLPGGTITVPVMAQDVDSSYEVCQAGIDLQYDASVVTVTNVTKGDIPSGLWIWDWEVFANNVATYQMDFFNVYEGNIIIAYVTFQAVGNPGDSCELQFGDWGNRFLGTFLSNYSGVDVSPLTFDDGTFTILSPLKEVEIDIKPGSDPNSINLKSKGVVPVAVLTTDDFDASDVDPTTVEFAGAEPVRWTMEDVDGDGDLDMLFHFKTQDLEELDEDSTDATLTGQTTGGIPIAGADTVNIVPKGK